VWAGRVPDYGKERPVGLEFVEKSIPEALLLGADLASALNCPPQPRSILDPWRPQTARVGRALGGRTARTYHYHCHEPNTCLIPNGFCSMGFALPGAIAASQVHPDRRILAVCGDGGFLMNVQEMETARRLGSDIVVMVWEDHAYGLIAWKQDSEFSRHTDLSFGNPDWMSLARAFGWHGHLCDASRDLARTLDAAFDESAPSLVVIPIDYRENALLTQKLGELAWSH
jgi:thiamine pyrophosphate-dependent acetolactate synthase large subunit-like protein